MGEEAALMCPVTLLSRACPVLATYRRDLDVRWLCSHVLECREQWDSLGGVTLVEVNVYRGPCVNERCDPPPPFGGTAGLRSGRTGKEFILPSPEESF